jgi:hypothetical protein
MGKKDTIKESTPATPVGARRTYFAHTGILHEGKLIKKGEKIPESVPDASLKQLILDKHVHHQPPGEMKVNTPAEDPGEQTDDTGEPANADATAGTDAGSAAPAGDTGGTADASVV